MGSQNDMLPNADRRRNCYSLVVSDKEKKAIEESRAGSGLDKTNFLRAALEAYCGRKIFRENVSYHPK